MKEFTEGAFAKVNLTLDVLDKREDGYHNLRSIMQTVSLHDDVHVTVGCEGWQVHCYREILSPDAAETTEPELCTRGLPQDRDNLVWKAAEAFYARTGKTPEGLEIFINKRIPLEAGLGGGSSDAAAVLRALRTLYAPQMIDGQLEEMAARLGSDVPFFIRGGTALATGRGEKLEALPKMPQCWLVIVKPEESHSTAAMYAAIDSAPQRVSGDSRAVREGLEKGDLSAVAAGLGNDFQQVLPEDSAVPAIVEALRQRGALNAQMTGSGSAVFGIFACRAGAEAAAEALKATYPRTFCVEQV